MDGLYKIDIRYFKKPTARKCLAIGVMVGEEDVERNSNSIVMAFDMAFRQLKNQIDKQGVKNVCKKTSKIN